MRVIIHRMEVKHADGTPTGNLIAYIDINDVVEYIKQNKEKMDYIIGIVKDILSRSNVSEETMKKFIYAIINSLEKPDE